MQRVYLFLCTVIQRIHAFFSTDTRLHQARFSRLDELNTLLCPQPAEYGLLLGRRKTQQLFKPDEGEGQIFTQRATVMLTQLFLAARHENKAPLPYTRSLIRSGLSETAARLNLVDPTLATQFLDVGYTDANLSDRFLLSSWGTLTARMRPLLTETVVRCFTHADFNAGKLLRSDKPVSIYLRWPEKDLLALSPLVRLLWGTLIDELISVYDAHQGKDCRPLLLLIDEAGRTAIPTLADHATTVVGRGISLWIAIQSLSQL